jgi:hypothetical protein
VYVLSFLFFLSRMLTTTADSTSTRPKRDLAPVKASFESRSYSESYILKPMHTTDFSVPRNIEICGLYLVKYCISPLFPNGMAGSATPGSIS